ncbi:MAG: TrmJ/YjtD family RNA methyltransferase [Xanthobacteraceae bacterium]
MSGAGTDKTKAWIVKPGPTVILVEPQLGDNIGAAARAMANFGLSELRLVAPRDGWPNPRAWVAASGADRILDAARLFDSVEAAVADCTYLIATTARAHDQAKPVIGPEEAARVIAPRIAAGETVGVMFGRERYGLENTEVALADRIVTLPVNPAFASLNLAQAVLVIAYEWFKLASGDALPFAMPEKSEPAQRAQLAAFFAMLERELDAVEFLRPPEKRETMLINLRNIFHRMEPTRQDLQTLHGAILAIAQGRKGPAKGGVLDGEEAAMLRKLLAEHGAGRVPSERGPVRGLARLLRRNPTDAERSLWEALTKDRRFAGLDFKRQTPIGAHIADLVSFPLRVVVDIVPAEETESAAREREQKRAWLAERDYRVIEVRTVDIEADVAAVLARLKSAIGE